MRDLLERLRAYEALATKAPWRHIAGVVYAPNCEIATFSIAQKDSEEHRANSELIVAMRNALPTLLAEREQQAEIIARLEEENERLLLRFGSMGLNPNMDIDVAEICGRLGAMGCYGHKPYPTHYINPDGKDAVAVIERLNTELQTALQKED